MSLHHSSPTTGATDASLDLALESKDALLKRLNDVVFRISKKSSSYLTVSAIAALHSEVDHIEDLIKGEENHPDSHNSNEDWEDPKASQTAIESGNGVLQSPVTPTTEAQMCASPQSPGPSRRQTPNTSTSRVIEVANVAEDLALQLAASIEELQTRKKESDHIHGLLITRAEKAAERIIYLESGISEMEDDFEANQSELRFLRIQLQAIEAQCSQYSPRDPDEELSQSIRNWKVDWEDIDRRSKARRMKRSALLANVHASRGTT